MKKKIFLNKKNFFIVLFLLVIISIIIGRSSVINKINFSNLKHFLAENDTSNYQIESTGETYETLAEAVEAASNEETITLLQDTVDDKIDAVITKNLILNTNEKTLDKGNDILEVRDGGILTIQGNGSIRFGGGSLVASNGGTLNVINGIITSDGNMHINNSDPYYIGGIVTPVAILCENLGQGPQSTINILGGNISQIYVEGRNSLVNVKGGVVENGIYNSEGIVNIGNKDGEFNITNPEVYGITNNEDGTWNFYNGILKSISSTYNTEPTEIREGYKIINSNGAEITNITYLIEESNEGINLDLSSRNGKVIAGNTLVAATVIGQNYGSLTVTSSNEEIATAIVEENALKITGIAEGTATITIISNEDSSKTVTYEVEVAKANYSITTEDDKTTYYSTLLEAYYECLDGETIKLINDAEDKSDITIKKNIILDLNSHTINRAYMEERVVDSVTSRDNYASPIEIQEVGSLTVRGEGTIKSTTPVFSVVEGGKLTIENGHIQAENASGAVIEEDGAKSFLHLPGLAVKCSSSNENKKAEVIIKGGIVDGIEIDGEYATGNILGGKLSTSISEVISIKNGTINIGNAEEDINNTNPEILGSIKNENGTLNFYNGVIKQPTASYIEPTTIRERCKIENSIETINNVETKTAYLIADIAEGINLDLSSKNGKVIAGNTLVAATVIGQNYGSLTVTSSNEEIATAIVEENALKITGIAEGTATITIISNEDSSKTVTYEVEVAKANYSITTEDDKTTYYSTLLEAYYECLDGETIKLINDAEDKSDITIKKNIILDLNSHTINRAYMEERVVDSVTSRDNYASPIEIQEVGSLTVRGEGTIKSTTPVFSVVEGGKLTIENGHIQAENASGAVIEEDGAKSFLHLPGLAVKCSSSNENKKAEVIIKGGIVDGIEIDGEYATGNILGGKLSTSISEVISIKNGTINIGNAEEDINNTNPEILGSIKNENGTLNFYNGVIKQPTASYIEPTTIRERCKIENSIETINNVETKTAYLIAEEFDVNEELVLDEENYIISKIQPDTNFEDFKDKITSSQEYGVYEGEEEISETDKMKTGQVLKVGNKEYTIVVNGDVDGDGNSNLKDILAINSHRLNKRKLTGVFLEAGDVNGDNKADLRDILRINGFRLKKINRI